MSSNEYVSLIKHENFKYLIKWDRKSEFFTLEDQSGDYIVVYKDVINNLSEEFNRLRELMQFSKPSKLPTNKQ